MLEGSVLRDSSLAEPLSSPATAPQQLSQRGQGIIGFALPAWKSTTEEVKSPAEVQEPVNTGPELALWVTRLLIPFSLRDPAAPPSSGNVYLEPSVGQALRSMWGVTGSLTVFMTGQKSTAPVDTRGS